MQMRLTEKQLYKMNSYVGCGPLLDANLLIMGNEEGTDGYPTQIEAHAAARFRLYGKDEATVSTLLDAMSQDKTILWQDDLYANEVYSNSPNRNWNEGYWEPKGESAGRKIKGYIMTRDGSLPQRTTSNPSAFNTHTGRICLAINKRIENVAFPIETFFHKNADIYKDVVRYTNGNLYSPQQNGEISTGLMDWRPLPRTNQSTWPPEYHLLGLDDREYIAAYKFEMVDSILLKKLVQKRLDSLKSILVRSRAKSLITIGEVTNKVEILRRMFPEQNLVFERLPFRNQSYSLQINLPNKKLNVYVLPFFNYFSLVNLQQAAMNFIIPDYFNEPRPKFEETAQSLPVVNGTFRRERLGIIERTESKENNERTKTEFLNRLKLAMITQLSIDENCININYNKYLQIRTTRSPSPHFEFCFRRKNGLEIGLHFEKNNDDNNNKKVIALKSKLEGLLNDTLSQEVFFTENWNSKKWARVYIMNESGIIDDHLFRWSVEKMKIFYETLVGELSLL